MLCMALSISVTIIIGVGIKKLSLFLEQVSKQKKLTSSNTSVTGVNLLWKFLVIIRSL